MISSRKALGPKNGSVFGVAGQEKEAVNGGSPAANGAGKSPKRPEVEEEEPVTLEEVGPVPRDLGSMGLKQMKRHLRARGVDYSGFHDKTEYKEMLQAIESCERAERLQEQADKEAGRA